jgi:hypothetical protein
VKHERHRCADKGKCRRNQAKQQAQVLRTSSPVLDMSVAISVGNWARADWYFRGRFADRTGREIDASEGPLDYPASRVFSSLAIMSHVPTTPAAIQSSGFLCHLPSTTSNPKHAAACVMTSALACGASLGSLSVAPDAASSMGVARSQPTNNSTMQALTSVCVAVLITSMPIHFLPTSAYQISGELDANERLLPSFRSQLL